MAYTTQKIKQYINNWKKKGYPEDIPDKVPKVLMPKNLAPSYRAIAWALLNNDLHLEALGFTPPYSQYYDLLKSIEFKERANSKNKHAV